MRVQFDKAKYDAAETKPAVFTRDGRPVRVLATDLDDPQPIATAVSYGVGQRYPNGKVCLSGDMDGDLFMEIEYAPEDEEIKAFVKECTRKPIYSPLTPRISWNEAHAVSFHALRLIHALKQELAGKAGA